MAPSTSTPAPCEATHAFPSNSARPGGRLMRAFVGVFEILLAALLVGGAGFDGAFFGWWGTLEPVGEIALSPRPGSRPPRPQRGTGERRRRRERGHVPGNCLHPGLVLADLRGPPTLGLALLDARPALFPRIHAREGLIGNGEAERRADRLPALRPRPLDQPIGRARPARTASLWRSKARIEASRSRRFRVKRASIMSSTIARHSSGE